MPIARIAIGWSRRSRREMPDITFDVPHGGYYLWLTLAPGVDGDELTQRAGEAGVTIIAGSKFFARTDAEHPQNHRARRIQSRLVDEIDEGVRRMARAYAALSARHERRSARAAS